MRLFLGAVLAFLPTTATFAEAILNKCDWPASSANIVEPWKDSTKTYSKGEIRIVWVDTGGEPACCSSHLVILTPSPADGPAYTRCDTLSDGPTGTGFQSVNIKDVRSSYNAKDGLLLKVPVERYIDGNDVNKDTINIRINRLEGSVKIEQ